MHKLLRLFLWFFLLSIFVASISFSLVNRTLVPLSLGVIEFSPQPLAVWVIAAFCLGGVSGLLLGAGLFRDLRRRMTVRQLQRELAERDREISQLKSTGRAAGSGLGLTEDTACS